MRAHPSLPARRRALSDVMDTGANPWPDRITGVPLCS